MDRLFPIAIILLLCILLTSSLVFAEPLDVQVQRYGSPAQKTFAYADKLYLGQHHNKWQNKIVVYNDAPINKTYP